jgi:cation transport ATPase
MNNSYNLFALGNYRFRILNLIFAAVFLAIDILTYLLRLDQYFTSRLNIHVYLNFMVLVSLVAVVSSRQKNDYEMAQKIRYAINKVTINFMVSLAALAIYFLSIFSIMTISVIYILYYMEFMLLLNILFSWLGTRYAPSWLFREPTSPETYNRMMLRLYVAIIVCLIVILIISQFVD